MERPYLHKLQNRLAERRRFIQVLLGPRQVGKTTIVKQLTKKLTVPFHFATADEASQNDTGWIEQQWHSVRLRMQAQQWTETVLIIDEIQRIQDWSVTVKKLWDEDSFHDRNIKVILLGSARIILQKGLTESLAGRFEETYVSHWSAKEMNEAFGWSPEQFAWFGGYPGSADLIPDEARWKDYVRNSLVESVVSKDIFMLNSIHKPALLRNLFELGCLYSGQILSYTKIIGKLVDAGNTTTLTHYQTLLESAGLVSGLEKFTSSVVRQRSSMPKWQVHNTALSSSQSVQVFDNVRQDAPLWGRVVESAVGAHLMKSYQKGDIELFYWREGNHEVDFVLKKGPETIALEVKSGLKDGSSGMSVFRKTFNPKKVLLVGFSGIPWQEFLDMDPAELF